VTDSGTPPLSASATFTVTVTEENQPPVLSAGSDETIDELRPWSRVVSATDPDLPMNDLTLSLVSGPDDLTFDSATRSLAWTPAEAQGPGRYPVTVRVTDGTVAVEQTFTLVVMETNQRPVVGGITASPNPVSIGEPVGIVITATDADEPQNVLTYSLAGSGLPDNLSGRFTWIAAGSGPITLTARVSDGTATVERVVSITVIGNTPPTISDIPAQETGLNQPTAWQSFTVGDQETAVGQLRVTAKSSNPILVPEDNIVLFEVGGAERHVLVLPALDQSGRASITLTVTDDGGLTAETTFDVVVCPGGPEITAQPTDQVAEPGMTVRFTVAAAGDGLSYQWFKETDLLAGQTQATLELVRVSTDAVGNYHVEVSDGLCRTTSNAVTLRLVPELEVDLYSVVTVQGMVGRTYQIEYRDDAGPEESWKPLAVLVMEQETQLFIDLSSPRTVKRLYRAISADQP